MVRHSDSSLRWSVLPLVFPSLHPPCCSLTVRSCQLSLSINLAVLFDLYLAYMPNVSYAQKIMCFRCQKSRRGNNQSQNLSITLILKRAESLCVVRFSFQGLLPDCGEGDECVSNREARQTSKVLLFLQCVTKELLALPQGTDWKTLCLSCYALSAWQPFAGRSQNSHIILVVLSGNHSLIS